MGVFAPFAAEFEGVVVLDPRRIGDGAGFLRM